jgi:hypothetical protein
MKTALILGVEVFGGVEFLHPVEPEFESDPWTIAVRLSATTSDLIKGLWGCEVHVDDTRSTKKRLACVIYMILKLDFRKGKFQRI